MKRSIVTNGPLSRASAPGIGFVLSHEQFTAPQVIEYGVAAEQAGFDMVWGSDHFQPWQDNEGHASLVWLTLAALGQRTRRVPFGTGVTCPTYRYHPAIVAQAFATLAQLYPGRVWLGVGAGEALNEQAATGQWGEHEERAARLVEAVQLIRRLWSGEVVNHEEQYYKVLNAKLYDVPPQPVPIYIAASGEHAMRLAGEHGDGLITDSKSLKEHRAAFEAGVRAAGGDPAQLPIIVENWVVVGDEAEARRWAELWRFTPKAWTNYVNNPDPRAIQREAQQEVPLEEVYKDWPVSTDPAVHVQSLQELFDLGVSHVMIHSPQADQQRVIDFYSREVLPRLRKR
jgi:TAT-translocated FGD2 family F420-dependent dehydrogenase